MGFNLRFKGLKPHKHNIWNTASSFTYSLYVFWSFHLTIIR